MQITLELPAVKATAKSLSVAAIKTFAGVALEDEVSVVIAPVSWRRYNEFVEETMGKIFNPLFYYSNEKLLIMPKLPIHEYYERVITSLVSLLTDVWRIDCLCLGSATFRRDHIEKGFEPDSCFYFGDNAKQARSTIEFEPKNFLAPDLTIEVDITSSSEMRESIFAKFGIAELWRFENEKLVFFKLENGGYREIKNSLALPLSAPEKAHRICAAIQQTRFVRVARQRARMGATAKISFSKRFSDDGEKLCRQFSNYPK